MHVIMAGDMCVCALLYEQNKVLLEGCEKELEGCRRSQNEVGTDLKIRWVPGYPPHFEI